MGVGRATGLADLVCETLEKIFAVNLHQHADRGLVGAVAVPALRRRRHCFPDCCEVQLRARRAEVRR